MTASITRGPAAKAATIDRQSLVPLFGLALLWLGGDWLLAQRVPLDTGFHWDGTYYIDYVRNIGKLFDGSLDPYSLSRVLPSILVHLGLRLTGQGFDEAGILQGFVILNGAAVLVSLWAWFGIAVRLQLSTFRLYLGALAFFGNFCFLKYNSFYPITTDVTAFALSMLMIGSYLARSQAGLTAASVLGAFTWPTILPLGCLLIALPRPREDAGGGTALAPACRTPGGRWLPASIALALGLTVAAGEIYTHLGLGYRHSGAPTVEALIWLSIPLAAIYVTAATAPLLRRGWTLLVAVVGNDWRWYARWAGLAVFVFLAVQALLIVGTGAAARNSVQGFLLGMLASSIKAPGLFLIAHFVFFGPVIVLAIAHWQAACAVAQRLGPGFLAATLLTVVLALGAESRQLMPHIAFVTVAVVAAVGVPRRPLLAIAAFALVSVGLSRIWVVMDLEKLVFSADAYLAYPWQSYFGAIGYWMRFDLYLIHMAAMFGTGLLFASVGLLGRRQG